MLRKKNKGSKLEIMKVKCSDKIVLNHDEGTIVKTNTWTTLFADELKNETNTKFDVKFYGLSFVNLV